MTPKLIVKVSFNGLLKARCETELETTYRLAAMQRKVDTSDIVRDALRDYAARALKPQSRDLHGV